LSSHKEWLRYCSGAINSLQKKPGDIPSLPPHTYRDKWISWGDWLGHNNRVGGWRSFADAKTFVKSLSLTSGNEWKAYCRGEIKRLSPKPIDVPSKPNDVYENEWVSMGDWLGTGRIASRLISYRPFSEARQFARELHLKSGREWKEYCAGKFPGPPTKPSDIPSTPAGTYKDEWVSMPDWLGHGKKIGGWMSFDEARAFVRQLGLEDGNQWRQYCRGKLTNHSEKPDAIPANPQTVYRGSWKGMKDWLDTDWWSFEKAREFVRSLGLNSSSWVKYCAGELNDLPPKPIGIPSVPYWVYRKEWTDFSDWFGSK
jgi:Phage-integrase repeat unit